MSNSATTRHQLSLDLGLAAGLLGALLAVFVVDYVIAAMSPAVLDLVFILDEGTELVESADAITRNWEAIVESFSKADAHVRVAIIPCPPDSTQIPRIAFTSDLKEFRHQLTRTETRPPNGYDPWRKTDCLDALEEAGRLEYRKEAARYVFLSTNTLHEDRNRLDRIAQIYETDGLKPIIQAHTADQKFYRPLYRHGGQFITLEGENRTEPQDASTKKKSDSDKVVEALGLAAMAKKPKDGAEPATLAGVKVEGKIALICDISGSMGLDFPPLVRELREKFPHDTPLILINGCHFDSPSGVTERPQPLGQRIIHGVDFIGDQHVYESRSTTEAILMAARVLRRDTVMFNNDLQDGGTEAAIRGFLETFQRSPFALSGRSLNCDAPQVLKDFIGLSGGEFKVDPISRTIGPAQNWVP